MVKLDLSDLTEPYNEDNFLQDFWYYHRHPGNILQRYNLTLDKLRRLPYDEKPGDTALVTGWKLTNPAWAERVKTGVHTHYGSETGKEYVFVHWLSLLEIERFGEISLLELVNYLRHCCIELPWFAQFDTWTANWTKYDNRYRAAPVEAPQKSK